MGFVLGWRRIVGLILCLQAVVAFPQAFAEDACHQLEGACSRYCDNTAQKLSPEALAKCHSDCIQTVAECFKCEAQYARCKAKDSSDSLDICSYELDLCKMEKTHLPQILPA